MYVTCHHQNSWPLLKGHLSAFVDWWNVTVFILPSWLLLSISFVSVTFILYSIHLIWGSLLAIWYLWRDILRLLVYWKEKELQADEFLWGTGSQAVVVHNVTSYFKELFQNNLICLSYFVTWFVQGLITVTIYNNDIVSFLSWTTLFSFSKIHVLWLWISSRDYY